MGARPDDDRHPPGPLDRRHQRRPTHPRPGSRRRAGAADLGPDHLDALCGELADHAGWDRDPARTVEAFRRRLKLDADEAAAIARCEADGIAYFTPERRPPDAARSLHQLGIDDTRRSPHHSEPCHAVYVERQSWSDRIAVTAYCINPKRHHQPKGHEPAASPIIIGRHHQQPDLQDDAHVKRRGRLARLAAGAELFAKRAGGPNRSELILLALHSYIDHASHDAAKFAATLLGIDSDHPHRALVERTTTSAGLAQVAGASACGTAEVEAYHSLSHGVTAWYRLLLDHGWQPDDWTQQRLATAEAARPAGTDSDDRQGDGDNGDGRVRGTRRCRSRHLNPPGRAGSDVRPPPTVALPRRGVDDLTVEGPCRGVAVGGQAPRSSGAKPCGLTATDRRTVAHNGRSRHTRARPHRGATPWDPCW